MLGICDEISEVNERSFRKFRCVMYGISGGGTDLDGRLVILVRQNW